MKHRRLAAHIMPLILRDSSSSDERQNNSKLCRLHVPTVIHSAMHTKPASPGNMQIIWEFNRKKLTSQYAARHLIVGEPACSFTVSISRAFVTDQREIMMFVEPDGYHLIV